MNEHDKPTVLCVDYESHVLESLTLLLRKDYQVHTAPSGDEGLRKLQEIGGAAVVISDMRMPRMDGMTFLKRVMHDWPEAARILLTGDMGHDTAVLVGEAQIFCFLRKPCSPHLLRTAIEAGVLDFKLLDAERGPIREPALQPHPGADRSAIAAAASRSPDGLQAPTRTEQISTAPPDVWHSPAANDPE